MPKVCGRPNHRIGIFERKINTKHSRQKAHTQNTMQCDYIHVQEVTEKESEGKRGRRPWVQCNQVPSVRENFLDLFSSRFLPSEGWLRRSPSWGPKETGDQKERDKRQVCPDDKRYEMENR